MELSATSPGAGQGWRGKVYIPFFLKRACYYCVYRKEQVLFMEYCAALCTYLLTWSL